MGSFSSCRYLWVYSKKVPLHCPYSKGLNKYFMNRPLCPVCNQRPLAINCYRNGQTYYRSRCEHCIKKNKKLPTPKPRWQSAGYKKKPACDKCGFKARYSAQLLVYHVDGNLHNSEVKNLKTLCLNCTEEIKRSDLPWKKGDLEPDA